jgi:hypothetical protein
MSTASSLDFLPDREVGDLTGISDRGDDDQGVRAGIRDRQL